MLEPREHEVEPPLDPAVLRVQARLRRLMLVGMLTLGVGLFAVLAAVIYRISTSGATGEVAAELPGVVATGELVRSVAGVSPGARLVSSALDGNRLALGFEEGGTTVVVIIDLATMSVVRRLRIGG